MVRTLNDRNLDDGDRKVLADIENYGCHIVQIPKERDTEGWAFTIGLFHKFNHPEVVVFGLSDELNGWVVQGIGADVCQGKVFQADKDYPEILDGVLCTFKPVMPRWYRPFLGYAQWFYRREHFPVLQCIWPDKQQHYPWDSRFKAEWAWAQPLLFHDEPVLARAVELLASMKEKEREIRRENEP